MNKRPTTSLPDKDELRYSCWLRCKDDEKRNFAMQRLFEANQKKVFQLALPYRETCPAIPIETLLKLGNLGLLWAFVNFVPRKQLRFSHFATWWINQAIKRGIIGILREKDTGVSCRGDWPFYIMQKQEEECK